MAIEHDYVRWPELTNTQIQEFGLMSPHKQITEDFRATVIKVHDGDTITLRTDFRDFDFPLRFLGIDAPEMNAGGAETRDWLIGQILNDEVEILIDINNRVGKYGRLLGKVMSRGMDVGTMEMNLGLAKPYAARYEGQLPNMNKELMVKKWF